MQIYFSHKYCSGKFICYKNVYIRYFNWDISQNNIDTSKHIFKLTWAIVVEIGKPLNAQHKGMI